MRTLKAQAIRDVYKAMQHLDATEVVFDDERDLAFTWSPDHGAALAIKLWSRPDERPVPMDELDSLYGAPETPHDAPLRSAKAVAMLPGLKASPLIRAALADVVERRRLAQINGSKDRTVQIDIGPESLTIGPYLVECQTWGEASTMVNGTYLQAAFDHCFGMTAYAVQLEVYEQGQVRLLMQSPNQQTEPDTRWRGQAIIAPMITRTRQEAHVTKAES